MKRKASHSCDSASGLWNSFTNVRLPPVSRRPSRPDAPLTHEAFFWETLKCSCSAAPVRTRAQLRQPVVSSRVQQAALQTGWNTHFISQSCHRNSAVVGTTHLPQELVLVGLSDDACYYKSSLGGGGVLKWTLRVRAHVPQQGGSKFHF